jgi:Putative small multi-drug export protein
MPPSGSRHLPAQHGHADVVASEGHFSDHFREEHPTAWFLTLIAPLLVTAAVLGAIGLDAGWDFVGRLARQAVITFFALGRFVILSGGDAGNDATLSSLTRSQLFLMVSYMDLLVAALLVLHAGVIFRIPRIGPKLAELQDDGHFILSLHPWMRRMTFVGLVAFIVFPLAATGSVGGAILGRLLGMTRAATFTAILIGSIIGNGIMWLFAGVISRHLNKDDPLLLAGGIIVLAAAVLFLNARYRKMKRAALDGASPRGSGGIASGRASRR